MAPKLMVGLTVMVFFVFSGATVVEAQKPTDVIETLESKWPGIQTELVEVKRMSDNTVRVKWRWRNTTGKQMRFSVRGLLQNETYLLDPVNKKKHFVVTDAKGNVIGSTIEDALGSMDIAANQAVMIWARFPAPPASVGRITVVIGSTPPFEDIAISK